MVKIGIYKITNLINNKCYIGQSTHIYRRWSRHKCKNNWTDAPLYKAFAKYGIDNFKFEILEECKKELLNEREIYWIQYFNSFLNGYNQTQGGDGGGHTIKLSPDKILTLIDDLQNSALTGKELALKYNVNDDMISMINNGKCWRQANIKYPIRYYGKPIAKKEITTCIDCGATITKGCHRCKACEVKYRLKNKKLNLNKVELADLVYKIGFAQVGIQFGITENAVRRQCLRFGMPTRTKDFKIWYEATFSPISSIE